MSVKGFPVMILTGNEKLHIEPDRALIEPESLKTSARREDVLFLFASSRLSFDRSAKYCLNWSKDIPIFVTGTTMALGYPR